MVHKLTKVSAIRAQNESVHTNSARSFTVWTQKIGRTCRNGTPTEICSFRFFLLYQKITFGPMWVGIQKGSRLDPHDPKGSPMAPKGPFGGRRPTEGSLGPYWGPWLLSPLGGLLVFVVWISRICRFSICLHLGAGILVLAAMAVPSNH